MKQSAGCAATDSVGVSSPCSIEQDAHRLLGREVHARWSTGNSAGAARTAVVSAILLWGAAVASAQIPDLYRNMDTDGNGKISRAEFPAGDALFTAIDANRDGLIEAAEGNAFWRALRGQKGVQKKAPAKGNVTGAVAAIPDDIEVQSDIVYKTVEGQAVKLDLYGLKGRRYAQAPLVVFFHGGGYVGGDKQGALDRGAEIFFPLLREHGYRMASVNYRLCAVAGAKLVDCSTDSKDALRFLVKNREAYGIDPDRIATMGTSAGGSLALLQSLTEKDDLPGDPRLAGYEARARCAVAWFGPTDFTATESWAGLSPLKVAIQMPVLFRVGPAVNLHEYEIVSPVWYMKHNGLKPPMLLVHGERDSTTPMQQSAWMDEEARKLGVPLTFVRVRNAEHGFREAGGPISPSRKEINQLTLNFLVENNQ